MGKRSYMEISIRKYGGMSNISNNSSSNFSGLAAWIFFVIQLFLESSFCQFSKYYVFYCFNVGPFWSTSTLRNNFSYDVYGNTYHLPAYHSEHVRTPNCLKWLIFSSNTLFWKMAYSGTWLVRPSCCFNWQDLVLTLSSTGITF